MKIENKIKAAWFHSISKWLSQKKLNSWKSIQISPCGVRWKSTVSQLLLSRCPCVCQDWARPLFCLKQSVSPFTAQHSTASLLWLFVVNIKFSTHIAYSVNKTTRSRAKISSVLQFRFALNQYLKVNHVVCLHNYTFVISVWTELKTARLSLLVEMLI